MPTVKSGLNLSFLESKFMTVSAELIGENLGTYSLHFNVEVGADNVFLLYCTL